MIPIFEISPIKAGVSRYWRYAFISLFDIETGADTGSRSLLHIGWCDGKWGFDLLWFVDYLIKRRSYRTEADTDADKPGE